MKDKEYRSNNSLNTSLIEALFHVLIHCREKIHIFTKNLDFCPTLSISNSLYLEQILWSLASSR